MPHDYNDNILSVGNIVWIPCRVKAVHLTEDYCNLDLQSMNPMPSYPNQYLNISAINSKQVRKDCGDFPPPFSELK